jgi:sugar-specific transcriptional regulator TrmB
MDNLKNTLINNLNFSEKKALIYLTLLELGEAVVVDIAKKANLKRTTVYNILPELIQEGFVKTTKKNKTKYFFVEDPKQLKVDAEERLNNIEKIVPELQSLQSVLPYNPKITFLEGMGGMKDLYEDIIKSVKPGDEILSFIGSINIYQFVPKEVGKRYIDNRIKKKVVNKIIATDTNVSREWQKNAEKELRII